MAKITNVIILDQTTIRLNQDAKIGDTIDLLTLNKVDISSLSQAISQATDKEYERRLIQQRVAFDLEKKNEIQEAVAKIKEEKIKLEQMLQQTKKDIQNELELNFEKERSVLKTQIAELVQEKKAISENKALEIDSALNKQKNEIQNKIQSLEQRIALATIEKERAIDKTIADQEKTLEIYKNQLKENQTALENFKSLSEKDKQIAIQATETELNTKIRELEGNIANLERNKSELSIKKLGENLENWCNERYQSYALNGFETCSWEKDNKAVKDDDENKGTKADYIFKVYGTTQKFEEELLTSVACEMKSEDPKSVHKKKNQDHYKKLDSDRSKKNCEYALLISELEWEQEDSPIKKIIDYDKMYLVRPQYFIVFLSIVAALGQKYKDILIENNKQKEQFKDSEEILKEFEDMKNNILNNSLKGIDKEVNDILKSADKIHDMSKEIVDKAQNIIDKRLDLIRRKIEDFNIIKIDKKIKNINQ
ncbi:MAG: DUF2130 domain-containing protein [Acholeplasmataceae bacterium]|nr:DUF2130 domain-containing protein [Acholeplasmataceae bacterium]